MVQIMEKQCMLTLWDNITGGLLNPHGIYWGPHRLYFILMWSIASPWDLLHPHGSILSSLALLDHSPWVYFIPMGVYCIPM